MKTFLYDCALSLSNHYEDSLAELTVVFASRRAERYFQIELSKLGIGTKPKFTTIDSVMQRFSQLETQGNLELLAELHRIYSEFHPGESFESFYSFGKLLLSDFDSVDKYMVDAKELYSIVSSTKDIEVRFEDQTHRLAYEFWHKFQKTKAEMYKEQQFVRIWSSLYEIYSRLREELIRQGKAYAGMIYRNAAQTIVETKEPQTEKFVFVGLNALSKSELTVLGRLHLMRCADFIWDYDSRWEDEKMHDAYYFIGRNISHLPQADYFIKSDTTDPQISIMATPSEVLQCKIALGDDQMSLDERTAIVLTDENLLEPLLHSLPEEVVEPNVSIALPIRTTQSYQLVEQLIKLQQTKTDKGFYHRQVNALLLHAFITKKELATQLSASEQLYIDGNCLTEAPLDAIFVPIKSSAFDLHRYIASSIDSLLNSQCSNISESERFALEKIRGVMDALMGVIKSSSIEISEKLYTKLFFEALGQEGIPFVGHSGKGMQITGILETRALDFDNVVILSLTDDNFPSAQVPASYIPQNLRVAYGLPSSAEHTAIWSYYFYRLLQRSSRVRLIYCNASTDTTSGEQSRYLYQTIHTPRYNPQIVNVRFATGSRLITGSLSQDKNQQTSDMLKGRVLSPSALNRYLTCPLMFYFSDIKSLPEEQDSPQEGFTNADIGNILHHTMQNLYNGRRNQTEIQKITQSDIVRQVELSVEEVSANSSPITSARDTIAIVALKKMVGNIVRHDANESAPFEILCMEKKISTTIEGITVSGTADRIDRMENGAIRIVDYKSGGDKNKCQSVEALFEGRYKDRNKAIVQLLTYGLIAQEQYNTTISVALYVARSMSESAKYDPTVCVGSERLDPISAHTMSEFRAKLAELVVQISSSQGAFDQSSNAPDCCLYCPYKPICLK